MLRLDPLVGLPVGHRLHFNQCFRGSFVSGRRWRFARQQHPCCATSFGSIHPCLHLAQMFESYLLRVISRSLASFQCLALPGAQRFVRRQSEVRYRNTASAEGQANVPTVVREIQLRRIGITICFDLTDNEQIAAAHMSITKLSIISGGSPAPACIESTHHSCSSHLGSACTFIEQRSKSSHFCISRERVRLKFLRNIGTRKRGPSRMSLSPWWIPIDQGLLWTRRIMQRGFLEATAPKSIQTQSLPVEVQW